MSFWTPLWLEMKHGVFTTLLNPSNHLLRWEIIWRNVPRIWRDFGSALPFQTRLTQTKPILPLSNEHGSQVKDQGGRRWCHNKDTKLPYRPTRDVSLLSGHASYLCGTPWGWHLGADTCSSWYDVLHGANVRWHTDCQKRVCIYCWKLKCQVSSPEVIVIV